jgi:drug/metabolite transporter (DMT)-like permease
VTVPTLWSALPGNARGAAWIILAGFCFATMGATVKLLGARLDPLQIAFFRCAFGLLFLLPFLLRSGGVVQALRSRRPGRHVARVVLGVIAMYCGFYAITRMPLADVTTLGFSQPLFMIPLAVLVLGEQIHRARWLATIAGFAGVLLMIGPGGGDRGATAWQRLRRSLVPSWRPASNYLSSSLR